LHRGRGKKGKSKGRALDIAPQVTNLRGTQVHGAHKAASHKVRMIRTIANMYRVRPNTMSVQKLP